MTELRKIEHGQAMGWRAGTLNMKRVFGEQFLRTLRFSCHRCGTEAAYDQLEVPLPTLVDRQERFHTYCSEHCEARGCSAEHCEHPREGTEEKQEDDV